MKIIIYIVLSILFLACGPSGAKKKDIELSITLHNMSAYNTFFSDSLEESGKKEIEIYKLKGINVQKHLKIHGEAFEANWNKPYEISKDYELTYEKYIEYCKANNKDPKTFYKFMN